MGPPAEDLYGRLEIAQRRARTGHAPAEFKLGDVTLYLSPTGTKGYPSILGDDELRILIAPRRTVRNRLHVKLMAFGLAKRGDVTLYEKTPELAAQLGCLDETGVSRIDLAVDWQGWVPTREELRNLVCRGRTRSVHGRSRADETFSFGKRPAMVRIYNKTTEAKAQGRSWAFERYRDNEHYKREEDVWRFEAEICRPVLKQVGEPDVAWVFENLDGLLAWALGWCELRAPAGKNRTRWQRDPRWQLLGEGSFANKPLPRLKAAKRAEKIETLIPQVAGLLVTIAAHSGVSDLPEVYPALTEKVEDHLASQRTTFPDKVEIRRRELGLSEKS